uniref:Solute carrier family 35 member D2 n=1 Tax=Astyanax mexicanus TaxID=7994 RepID=A0A8B9JCS7_ASTMX
MSRRTSSFTSSPPSPSPSPSASFPLFSPAHRDGRLLKLVSAVFYAVSSFLIIVINKTVLTNYRFPSYTFLGIGQMAFTIIILYLAKSFKAVSFQDFDKSIPVKMFPLPLLYVGNHVTGLGSTKKLRKTFSPQLVCSVLAIVFGALIAASSDLAFDAEGYTFVLLNDVFTAASGVYTKKKLGIEGLGKYGLLFYNAFIIIIPTILASAYTGDLEKAIMFKGWMSLSFIVYFLMSCAMGFVLMYSIVLCSHYNSALTTTVIGAIKNVAVAYIGMFIGGDYVFSWPNFVGLNICISGGLVYSYLTFHGGSSAQTATQEESRLRVHVVEENTEEKSQFSDILTLQSVKPPI